MSQPSNQSQQIYYPPGGILLWILIYVELFTFGLALFALAFYGAQEREIFHQQSLLLNKQIGTVNTLLLLTSGYFVARGVLYFKQNEIDKTLKRFNWAILLGFGFLILKGIEYSLKLNQGFHLDYSTFFMFYWLLTGFHWIHVLVGIVILFAINIHIKRKRTEANLEDIEAGAAFWHMCDIIWLLLFPLLYLIF